VNLKSSVSLGLILAMVATAAGGISLSGTVAVAADSPGLSHAQWDKVAKLVEGDPDTFAGVSVDSSTGIGTVYLTENRRGSKAAQQAIQTIQSIAASPRSVYPIPENRRGSKAQPAIQTTESIATASRTVDPIAWTLAFGTGTHSLRELNAVMDKATHDPSWIAVAGPYLSAWYVDPKVNAVRIGVTEITPTLMAAESTTFGDLAILSIRPRPQQTNRAGQADSSPWWGGDAISDQNNLNGCTGGFAVTYSGGGQVMLTAGHCYPSGTLVAQPYYYSNCMGQVGGVVYGNYSYDAELIDVSYCGGSVTGYGQGYVYTTGVFSRPIGGTAHAYTGDQACFDGSRTEENCSGIVDNSDGCYQVTGGPYLCHMVHAYSTNSSLLAQSGDSGGPVYEISGSKVYAQGLITSIESGGTSGWFSPMWRIVSDFALTTVTCGC
jgi:hypothetical protein